MQHKTELTFFKNILKNYHIPCHIIESSCNAEEADIDFGLRELISPDIDHGKHLQSLLQQCEANKIYRIRDPFYCYAYLLQTPDDSPVYVLVGPFTTTEITERDILEIMERYSLAPSMTKKFQEIYHALPIISDGSGLLTLLNTLGEQLWEGIDNFSLQDVYHSIFFDLEPVAKRPEDKESEDAFLSMEKLEKQYASENRLLQAVMQGQTHKAEMLISAFPRTHVEKRSIDPLRNLKNYAVITNTLMRKAAEQGHVHPLHIDSLSSRFAKAIEEAHSNEKIYALMHEMAHKYCLLVKNHSMEKYSPLVQKILVRIDSDLTADLSLKTQAAYLNVNASYLSALFKKEIGTTLTDYIAQKRVEHGIFLLNSTNLQIQTIAQHCGIPDVNYFTKSFKKYMHQTPTQYRNSITLYSREQI